MRLLAFFLQALCIGCTSVGLSITYALQDNLGFVLITGGALCFAVAEKIHRYVDKRPVSKYWFKWLKRKY